MVEIKFQRLRNRMAAYGVNQTELGRIVKRGRAYAAQRLNGEKPWTLREMYWIMDALKIDPAEMYLYFSRDGEDVEKQETNYIQKYCREHDTRMIGNKTANMLKSLVNTAF